MPARVEELCLLQPTLLMAEKRVEEAQMMGKGLLVLNCILLSVGTSCGPLVMRLYYIHGGKRIWLSSFLETAAFPVILFPLAVSYIRRRRRWLSLADQTKKPKLVSMKLPLFLASAVVGFISGFDNYLYAYGIAWLPLSTSSLIIASQLAFTAVFAYLLVRQKFTFYSINAVVLLTIGAVVLALHSSGDRPKGETSKQYAKGFAITVAAALLYGFILPLVELMYKKIKQPVTYSLVMEVQLVVCVVATLFCIAGMVINNDFKVIPREAREFELGEAAYYAVLVCGAIIWQTFFLGSIGVIFCASSLLSGVIISVFLPITELLAVVFYKESFQAEKGVALALSLWGFVSYIYGEKRQTKNENKIPNPATHSSQSIP